MPGPSEREYWPTAEWRVGAPETQGLDGTALGEIDAYARTSMPPIRAVVVVRGGDIVFEAYYDGASQDTYLTVNSVTKSVISMLVGIALRDGLLASVEQPIFKLLPGYDTQTSIPGRAS
jgi:CubicO group peptidase (beta-lactamase class C family)